MKAWKPFKYTKHRSRKYSGKPPRSDPIREGEVLTGIIDGAEASDIEERFAMALTKRGISFEFQPSYVAGRNVPGEIRLDFMVYPGGDMYPVQIDGPWIHHEAGQKAEDADKDIILDDVLSGTGAQRTQRVSGELLATQDAADALVKGMFL